MPIPNNGIHIKSRSLTDEETAEFMKMWSKDDSGHLSPFKDCSGLSLRMGVDFGEGEDQPAITIVQRGPADEEIVEQIKNSDLRGATVSVICIDELGYFNPVSVDCRAKALMGFPVSEAPEESDFLIKDELKQPAHFPKWAKQFRPDKQWKKGRKG